MLGRVRLREDLAGYFFVFAVGKPKQRRESVEIFPQRTARHEGIASAIDNRPSKYLQQIKPILECSYCSLFVSLICLSDQSGKQPLLAPMSGSH